tara:strand:+ start:1335 stop:2390 length:1056 start_codon:yes stop_codon:yes gene_type:complete
MKNIIKIIFFNTIILFTLVLVSELFFGYWFDKYDFGIDMRGKRIEKNIYEYDNKKILYTRDFFGFRSNGDISNKYDPSKIKIIFTGGSTGDEQILNYRDTIVGQLNNKLKNNNINTKIYNASLSGKSLKGHVNEFPKWFSKIPNFKPSIIIYYFGINDRKIQKNRFEDYEINLNKKKKLLYLISQKSFFWERFKIIKNKYFSKKINMDQYFTKNEILSMKLKNNEFTSYENAKMIYGIPNKSEKKIIENYKNNLKKLNLQIKAWNIKPIFITQITYNINGNKILFLLNAELKKFAKEHNYPIIKLDELILQPLNNSFVDETHTNEKGSSEIAKILFPLLKDEILKKLNVTN